jgi:aryl-alcohol dehydrogenase-like predicted oxidoreductase
MIQACQPKHYAEPLVGHAVAKLTAEHGIARETLFLQTKFTPYPGQDPKKCPYDPKMDLATQVRVSAQTSLVNLQTDWIDSLVLHSPLPTHADTMTAWRVFEELVDAGKVKEWCPREYGMVPACK